MAPSPSSEDAQTEFHISEYNALRTEIMTHIRDVRVMQRGSLLGIAVFFAWYLTLAETLQHYATQIVIIWLPIIVLYFVAKLSIMKIDSVHEAGRYIAQIEEKYAHPEIKGWETHLTQLREKDPKAVKADRVDKGFWFSVAAVVLLMSAIETVRLLGLIFNSAGSA